MISMIYSKYTQINQNNKYIQIFCRVPTVGYYRQLRQYMNIQICDIEGEAVGLLKKEVNCNAELLTWPAGPALPAA